MTHDELNTPPASVRFFLEKSNVKSAHQTLRLKTLTDLTLKHRREGSMDSPECESVFAEMRQINGS